MNTNVEVMEADAELIAAWHRVMPEIEKAWGAVFRIVNKVVSAHDHFGFELIEKGINPSIPDILRALKMLEAILDAIPVDNIDYDMSRLLVNAKQQIVNFELVVTALKYNRQDDYEAAMLNLRSQVQF